MYMEQLIDKNGNVILDTSSFDSGWSSVCGTKGPIAYNCYVYDSETEKGISSCHIFDRSGNELTLERNYTSLNPIRYSVYGSKDYDSYSTAQYEEAGNTFTALLDENGKELISNIKNIYSIYDNIFVYEKGFELCIYDMAQNKLIYSEDAFQTLSD